MFLFHFDKFINYQTIQLIELEITSFFKKR